MDRLLFLKMARTLHRNRRLLEGTDREAQAILEQRTQILEDARLQAALQVLLDADTEEELAEAQEIARRILAMGPEGADAALAEAERKPSPPSRFVTEIGKGEDLSDYFTFE